jgi:Pup-like protein
MESASSSRPRPQMQKREAERLAEEDAGRVAERSGDREVLEDADELLDEIDALLEEQSVLTNFRQKGGQ